MSKAHDPEVIADLALRVSSEMDRARGKGVTAYLPPNVVQQWPCRSRSACSEKVDVTEEVFEVFRSFNRELRQRGEEPIDAASVAFCLKCWARGQAIRADENRRQVDKVGEVIRELKQGTMTNEQQVTAFGKLRKWGHPDVPGLETWLRENRSSGAGKRRGM